MKQSISVILFFLIVGIISGGLNALGVISTLVVGSLLLGLKWKETLQLKSKRNKLIINRTLTPSFS